MQHEKKKIASITNELLTVLLMNGACDIDVHIETNDERSEISIIHHDCDYDEELVDKIRQSLNTQRQVEVEGYYWQLVGDSNTHDELHLVGSMVDEADVFVDDRILHINLVRKLNK